MHLVVCTCGKGLDELSRISKEYYKLEVQRIITEKKIHPKMYDLYEDKETNSLLLFEFLGLERRCCRMRLKLARDDDEEMYSLNNTA